MFRPSLWPARRHDTGSRFSVCAESRFGRCAAGDDRKAGAITPTAAARSRFRHSAGSRSGSPGKHRAVCGTSGLSGCVRTGLAGVPVACRSKPEEIRFQCLEGQITRGVPPEAMLDGVRRYARYLAATGKTGTEFVQRATTFLDRTGILRTLVCSR